MKQLLPALFLITTSIFAQTGTTRPVAHVTTYQPPVFTDPDRLKRLEAAFPVVEKIYREAAEKRHLPGIAFGIVLDGKLVYSGGIGYTDVGKKIPATPKSLFRIASMTKSLTSMAILKLRDEGKLQLDEPAETYIPELKSHKYLTADAPRITVRNLMTHSAGFPEDNPWGDRQLDDSDADLLKLIQDGISNSNVPGFTYEYSNLGFAMLGHIITVVSGKPYQQYITETILKPLGMHDTQWEYTKVPTEKLALGYRWQDDKWLEEPLLHDGSYGAMGGLITSIDDFSKYVALHQSAWPPSNAPDKDRNVALPIKRSSLREMQKPWTLSGLNAQAKNSAGQLCPEVSGYGYGLRWGQNCKGQIGIGHTGGLPGFGSQWRILTDYGVGIISYANLTYAGMGTVNAVVLDTLMGIGKLPPSQLPVSPILAQRKAELVKLLPDWTNAERSGIFAENFFPDKSVAIRRKVMQDLYAKVGTIQRIGELIPENQLRGHFLLEGSTANIDVFFTLTPENPALIQQLDFREVSK